MILYYIILHYIYIILHSIILCESINGWFSMSPLPRLHHHDVMSIVELFTYRQYVIYIYIRTIRTSRNVGALKVADLHCSRQQCVVVEWSGRSVAVRVRVKGLTSGTQILVHTTRLQDESCECMAT